MRGRTITSDKAYKMKRIILSVILLLLITGIIPGQTPDERPKVNIGGALRFNYNHSDWNPGHRSRWGDFGYDVFMLHPTASYKGFLLDADARFYSTAFGGFMLKYGWIGYRFSSHNHIEVGLTRVPFGIHPSSANNFFFQISYYVGLEDDSDMGIKYIHRIRTALQPGHPSQRQPLCLCRPLCTRLASLEFESPGFHLCPISPERTGRGSSPGKHDGLRSSLSSGGKSKHLHP